jgi:hypothetical protein
MPTIKLKAQKESRCFIKKKKCNRITTTIQRGTWWYVRLSVTRGTKELLIIVI